MLHDRCATALYHRVPDEKWARQLCTDNAHAPLCSLRGGGPPCGCSMVGDRGMLGECARAPPVNTRPSGHMVLFDVVGRRVPAPCWNSEPQGYAGLGAGVLIEWGLPAEHTTRRGATAWFRKRQMVSLERCAGATRPTSSPQSRSLVLSFLPRWQVPKQVQMGEWLRLQERAWAGMRTLPSRPCKQCTLGACLAHIFRCKPRPLVSFLVQTRVPKRSVGRELSFCRNPRAQYAGCAAFSLLRVARKRACRQKPCTNIWTPLWAVVVRAPSSGSSSSAHVHCTRITALRSWPSASCYRTSKRERDGWYALNKILAGLSSSKARVVCTACTSIDTVHPSVRRSACQDALYL